MAKVPFIIEAKTKGLSSANSKIGKLSGSMKGLTVAAGATAVAVGAMGLGKALFNIGKASVDTAAQFEMLKVRLNVMYGSVQRGTQAFKAFNDVAATTPFQLQNVVEAGVSLKSFGADAEEMIKPVSDLAAFMGVDVVDAASAFGRAFAGGAGAADMLRDRGVLPLIASFAGVEHVSELTLPEFRDAMERALIDPSLGIAGMTTQVAGTWTGMVSNFQDGVDRLKAAIGDELLKVLKPKLDAINTEFSKLGEIGFENIAQAISEDLETATELARITARAMGQILGVVLITGMKEGLNLMFPTVGDLLFAQIRMYIDGFRDLFGEGVANFLNEKVDSLIASNEALSTSFVDLGTDMSTEISAIMAQLDEDTKAMLKSILDNAKKIKKAKGDPVQEAKVEENANKIIGDSDDDLTKKKIANAAKGAQTARAGIQNAIRGYIMEGVAGYAAKALAQFPVPLNLILAGAAGGLVNELITSLINQIPAPKMSFAQGGSFVTAGAQSIMVGDNPSGQELVTVTPLDAGDEPMSTSNNINVTISGNVMSESYTEDVIVPHIKEALRRGQII